MHGARSCEEPIKFARELDEVTHPRGETLEDRREVNMLFALDGHLALEVVDSSQHREMGE